jgi:PadR family transcriptional regulator PadR
VDALHVLFAGDVHLLPVWQGDFSVCGHRAVDYYVGALHTFESGGEFYSFVLRIFSAAESLNLVGAYTISMSDIPTSDIVYLFLNRLSKSIGAGAFSLLILSAVKRRGKTYGYEIMKSINNVSKGKIEMNESTLYPLLRSLDEQGLLTSSWEQSQAGPPRRCYAITKEGDEALKRGIETWRTMDCLMKGMGKEGNI